MKFLTLSFLAICAASVASAATIGTVLCPTAGGSGASGTTTSSCNTLSLQGANITLDSLTLTFRFNANFGIGSGSVTESFDVLPVGSGDAFGGGLDHQTGQMVTDTAKGITGTFTFLNPTTAEVNAALGGLQIQDSWSSGTGSFNSTEFDYQIDVSYTATFSGAPEPATLGLMGEALLGLAFLARKRAY